MPAGWVVAVWSYARTVSVVSAASTGTACAGHLCRGHPALPRGAAAPRPCWFSPASAAYAVVRLMELGRYASPWPSASRTLLHPRVCFWRPHALHPRRRALSAVELSARAQGVECRILGSRQLVTGSSRFAHRRDRAAGGRAPLSVDRSRQTGTGRAGLEHRAGACQSTPSRSSGVPGRSALRQLVVVQGVQVLCESRSCAQGWPGAAYW